MEKPILIISEKPAASQKIAYALADGKVEAEKHGKVTTFLIERNKKQIIIAPSVGHLFTLSTTKKGYPVTEYEWTPTYEREAKFAKPYFDNFKKLADKTDSVIIACDDDVEGSVIGDRILRLILKKQDAKRMKFSTLTKIDLQASYNNLQHLDVTQIESGLARHTMDFLYGISLTKAASSAVTQSLHYYKTLSIGRVQGPTLALLAEKEKEILKFIPKPYWQIFADINLKGQVFTATHEEDKFWEEARAKAIYAKVKDKPARLADIKVAQEEVKPPVPFDLTTLQTEAWRCFKISPKQTLATAQDLYTKALISYPRTSSQQLPPQLGLKRILTELSKQPAYGKLIGTLTKTVPRQGLKSDPAHPAIHPTGEMPSSLEKYEKAIYDLIARRFISTFGESAMRESTNLKFSIEREPFVMTAIKTVKHGWLELYYPYSKREETELPSVKVNEIFSEKTSIKEDKTKPPARYTPASLLKLLESKNLGTKSTRSSIIDILYQRGYVQDVSIQVTALGLTVVDTFSKFAPEIVSEELTAKFEKEMDDILEGKQKREIVVSEAKEIITKICAEFKEHKTEIGEGLASAMKETQKVATTLMPCPKCKEGEMVVRTSRKSGKRFLACSAYPKCENTWSLPQYGGLHIQKAKCKSCSAPLVSFITKGKKPWIICVNPECESRKQYAEKQP